MSLSTVLTMGFQPAGDISQIVLMGYGTTGEAPPIPPPVIEGTPLYGPALTPAERRRWFGADFDSPVVRAAKRRARERLKRIEIGLEEEERDEFVAQVEAKVEQIIEREEIRAAPRREDYSAIVERVAKRVNAEIRAELDELKRQRAEMEEEERDAIELMAILRDLF